MANRMHPTSKYQSKVSKDVDSNRKKTINLGKVAIKRVEGETKRLWLDFARVVSALTAKLKSQELDRYQDDSDCQVCLPRRILGNAAKNRGTPSQREMWPPAASFRK